MKYYRNCVILDCLLLFSTFPVTQTVDLSSDFAFLDFDTQSTFATPLSNSLDESNNDAQNRPYNLSHVVKNITDCREVFKVEAQEGYISIGDLSGGELNYQCDVDITVQENMLIYLHWISSFRVETSCTYCSLIAVDNGHSSTLLTYPCFQVGAKNVLSFTNKVRITLRNTFHHNYLQYSPCFFVVRFKAVPSSSKPQLELKYSSPYQGYIQTPGWDGIALYPPLMDSWVALDIPEDHTVMLTYFNIDVSGPNTYIQCERDFLQVFVGGTLPTNLVWEICLIHNDFVVKVFNTSIVHVHFVSDYQDEFTGFRLLFTFLNDSAQLEQLSDNKWNCSVPHWPKFQHNFPCDLVPQCINGEDEATCPYISQTCEPGLVLFDDICYLHVADIRTDWWGANEFCLDRKMRLATLNTPEKFSSVTTLLRVRPRTVVFLIGLQIAAANSPHMYPYPAQWVDGTKVYYGNFTKSKIPSCGYMYSVNWEIYMEECSIKFENIEILCEKYPVYPDKASSENIPVMPYVKQADHNLNSVAWQVCPQDYFVHLFLSCDAKSHCLLEDGASPLLCLEKLNSSQRFFACVNGFQHLPYTWVCDHSPDCTDKSDENFCVFQDCNYEKPFTCGNGQCVSSRDLCDGKQHCGNGADELCPRMMYSSRTYYFPSPPVLINLDSNGKLEVLSLTLNKTDVELASPCPDTHFKCPGRSVFCMPVFVRCNGVYDCPGKEDEAQCDNYLCPTFYRCRNSKVCVHPSHLCDGFYQCPLQDDELLCDIICPTNCTCHGLSFLCTGQFPAEHFRELRYLDATGAGLRPEDTLANRMLIHAIFAHCNLYSLGPITLPNLVILDLRDNFLSALHESYFKFLSNLKSLVLSGNPLSTFFSSYTPWLNALPSVVTLDMSRVGIDTVNVRMIKSVFPSVQHLNLSATGLKKVEGGTFKLLKSLKTIDLRGCPLTTFPRDVFRGLEKLESIDADNYKLCCPQVLPDGFDVFNCRAPPDEISSCDALLGSKTYKIFLSLYSAIALIANVGCLGYRCRFRNLDHKRPIGILLTNLCVANFLTGVYLAIISIADLYFQNSFLWHDEKWRNSVPCKIAGFIAWLSSLVSVFAIFLITLDRVLVLYPQCQRHCWSNKSVLILSLVVSVGGFLSAVVFLLPEGHAWHLSGLSSICIPLLLSSPPSEGGDYVFKAILIPTLSLSFVTGFGQVMIILRIKSKNEFQKIVNQEISDDIYSDTRQILNLIVSDLLCWIFIGCLGFLSVYGGVSFSTEMNVALAIIVIPLNSALNPILFVFNLFCERNRRISQERLIRRLKLQVNKSIPSTKSR